MKVTITAPFGRVQVEMNAGEAAQLMHLALDWAERGESDGKKLADDGLPGVPLMPTEENRGGEEGSDRRDQGPALQPETGTPEGNHGSEAEDSRTDALQPASCGETERPEAAPGDDRTVPGFVGGGVITPPYDENAAAAAAVDAGFDEGQGAETDPFSRMERGRDDRESGNPSVTADAVPAPFAQGSLATASAGLKDGTQEYRGFLYTRCEKCLEVRGYFTKKDITKYTCTCGHRTPLGALRKLTVKCYCCGTEIRYRTNLTEDHFTVACHNCGAPVEVELHSKLKEYVTF